MLNVIVARRPCGCVSAVSAISDKREYGPDLLAWIGELVVDSIQRGDKITHEHEPVVFGGKCDKCRKEPADAQA